jgi:hypothetical protein
VWLSTATPETLVIPDTGDIVSDAVFFHKDGGAGGLAIFLSPNYVLFLR